MKTIFKILKYMYDELTMPAPFTTSPNIEFGGFFLILYIVHFCTGWNPGGLSHH